jgi:hypothetical protein
MTTPSSGSISIQNIATELSISVNVLSLNDSRVRTLAGVSSGTISMGNLRGKSNYTVMSYVVNANIGGNNDVSTYYAAQTPSCETTVTVSSGSGGYTYAWSLVTVGYGCTLSNANQQTCSVYKTAARHTAATAVSSVQCVITDNTGHTVTTPVTDATIRYNNIA